MSTDAKQFRYKNFYYCKWLFPVPAKEDWWKRL